MRKEHLISARIDDVTPGMDWKNFENCICMLASHGIKPLLGVVPDCKDNKLNVSDEKADFWEYIRKLQDEGYVIAMHGYQHLYVSHHKSLFPIGTKSEFSGLSYEEQFDKIKSGTKILEKYGIHTNIFMAPSHSYDRNTLKALKDNGFRYVTDGYAKNAYEEEGLVFFPICNSIRRIDPLSIRWNSVTIVLHTNQMSANLLRRYDNILKTIECCSYNDIIEMSVVEDKMKEIKKECKREIRIERICEGVASIKKRLRYGCQKGK